MDQSELEHFEDFLGNFFDKDLILWPEWYEFVWSGIFVELVLCLNIAVDWVLISRGDSDSDHVFCG